MKKQHIIRSSHRNMRGFEYLLYSAFSCILLIVLLLLPLAPAFADETLTVTEDTATVDTPIEPATENETVVDTIPAAEITTDQNSIDESTSVNLLSADSEVLEKTTEQTDVSIQNDEVPVLSDLDVIPEDAEELTSEETEVTEISTSSDEVEITDVSTSSEEIALEDTIEEIPDVVVSEESTSTPEESIVSEDISSSTDPIGMHVEALPTNTITNDENRFTFSNTECATVGDGAFYCSKSSETPNISETDRVFAAVDTEGDKEIYIEKDSELIQITNNQSDDDAPYYDQLSNTLVWHRLIDGRYQIISYDIEEGKETQITNDRYNNMEPNRFGNATVWQGWVGNDWEIFFLEGDTLLMLTDNTTHDIGPSINGTHIVWQSFEGDVWKMKVYDTRTKSVQTIEGDAGGSIENPRFVLVYDKKFETGDIETHGYNLENGEIVNLGSTPAPVPSDIPDPEQTGEKSALVTPPTQPKTKVGDDTDTDPIPGTEPEIDSDDLVIPPLTPSDDIASSTAEIGTSIDQNDVVIPSISQSATTSVEHIKDLVITPYVEQIEVLGDSQETVAPTF